jgi:hypothetical protein
MNHLNYERKGTKSYKQLFVNSIAMWPTFAAEAGVHKDVADPIAGFHLLKLGKA